MSEKKSLFHKLSDITNLHHRAAFSDLAKHTAPKKSDFLKLAAARYSCRAFTPEPVSEADQASILEAARLAPTAVNKQPVHVWVFKTPESLAKLQDVTRYTFSAPVVFLVACNPEEAWVRSCDGKNGAEIDAAIVGTHIMMEAASLGLGSTWVGSFDPAKLQALFPQTSGWVPVALFPVGHPSGKPSERHSERKPLSDLVSEL